MVFKAIYQTKHEKSEENLRKWEAKGRKIMNKLVRFIREGAKVELDSEFIESLIDRSDGIKML